jgi:hypothetical protein
MGGGAIAWVLSSSASFELLLRPLLPTRLAISVLASVVSEGSPGSSKLVDPLETLSWIDERSRLAGGFESIELLFLVLRMPDSAAVVSPSSPDASRDDGCS